MSIIGITLIVVALLSASSAGAETFELTNGDKVTGEVLERTPDAVVLEHPILGRIVVPAEKIKPPEINRGVLGTSFLQGWDKELDLGLTGSRGNTDEADVRAGLDLNYQDETTRWKLLGAYLVGSTEGDIDDHNAHVDLTRDWLRPDSRWFTFALTRYDFDEFESWEHRVSAGGGPGYHIIQSDRFNLEGRFGPAVTYEFGDKNQLRPEAILGLFSLWQIGKSHSLSLSNTVLPTLNAFEVRNRTVGEWKIRLSEADGINLKFGIQNEYDTDADDERNNLKYYSAVALDF